MHSLKRRAYGQSVQTGADALRQVSERERERREKQRRQAAVSALCLHGEERESVMALLRPFDPEREMEFVADVNSVVFTYKTGAQTGWGETVPARKEGLEQINRIYKTAKK